MKRIYNAANLPEAHLLADRLRASGIEVHILNINAVGALGEVPAMDALPQLWLRNPAHAALARSIIEHFMTSPVQGAAWICPNCSEENPGTFDCCWQCNASPQAAHVVACDREI